jgi:translation initiation factor 2 gamma subunit (eIF-2gamma)
MSDRMFAQTCPNCGGICPQEAETCKYCKFSFEGPSRFSLDAIAPGRRVLKFALIALAILMIVALLVINILRS